MTEHHHPVARTRRIAVGVLILALVLGFGLWCRILLRISHVRALSGVLRTDDRV